MGALFSAGWTVDDVLDLSWDQIGVVASCTASYRAFQLNLISEIAGSIFGGPSTGKASRKKATKPRKKESSAKKEQSLASRFSSLGISVDDVG